MNFNLIPWDTESYLIYADFQEEQGFLLTNAIRKKILPLNAEKGDGKGCVLFSIWSSGYGSGYGAGSPGHNLGLGSGIGLGSGSGYGYGNDKIECSGCSSGHGYGNGYGDG